MMRHLKFVFFSFITVFSMLAYQNCQKMDFTASTNESNQSSLSLEPSTVAFELNYFMGYGYCMGRCMTGAKISADLETGVLTVNNFVYDSPSPIEAQAAMATAASRTKFNFQLSAEQLQKLKKTVSAISFEEHFVPECVEGGICSLMVDNANFTHFFKDNAGDTHRVFTSLGVDPNLRGEYYWVMDDARPLGCEIKSILQAGGLTSLELEESLYGLTNALNFYDSNPLVCSN